MPPPLRIDKRSYAHRVIVGLFDECVTANQTEKQKIKYLLLVLAATTPTPAAPGMVVVASGAALSDAYKCAIKALVNASIGKSAKQKRADNAMVDGLFS